MIDIILTILTFTSMLILFKLFERFKVDNLQAIVVNYITAGICGVFIMGNKFDFEDLFISDYSPYAFIVGLLFIFTFNLIAFGTQKIGIAITTVANKMSMIIPVVAGIYFFNEQLNIVKIIGIVIALIAIYFTSTTGGKLSFNKKYLWLILVILIGQGIADTTFNIARATTSAHNNIGSFFSAIFFCSSILGFVFLLLEIVRGKTNFHLKSLLWGIVLGIPNFATLFFFFRSLQHSGLESSQVFPIINMGVIILSSIMGIILFKEKLQRENWTGVLLAVVAIALITFSANLIVLF